MACACTKNKTYPGLGGALRHNAPFCRRKWSFNDAVPYGDRTGNSVFQGTTRHDLFHGTTASCREVRRLVSELERDRFSLAYFAIEVLVGLQ